MDLLTPKEFAKEESIEESTEDKIDFYDPMQELAKEKQQLDTLQKINDNLMTVPEIQSIAPSDESNYASDYQEPSDTESDITLPDIEYNNITNSLPSTAIRNLNRDLDDIDAILNRQESLRGALSSQGDYMKFIDTRFNKLENLAQAIGQNKERKEANINLMDSDAYNKLNHLDQKIDQLLEENKTKQSTLEEAIRDLIATLQQKNKTIISKQPTPENLPNIIKEVDDNINDLDAFKTLDVDPAKINESKDTMRANIRENLKHLDELNEVKELKPEEMTQENIIQSIDQNMEKIRENQKQLQVARQLLEKFKEDYENTLVKVLENNPIKDPNSSTNRVQEEINNLKENQEIIKQVVAEGKTECPLRPTKSKLGAKQIQVASLCTDLNKQKLSQLNMIDGIVKKHIETRHKYTKKYTTKIRNELNNLRRKVARRNVDLAILLDQL